MIDRRDLLAGLAAGGVAVAAGRAGAQRGLAERPPVEPPPDATGIDVRWAFSVTVLFEERVMIQAPFRRAFVPAAGGEIWGPRLSGRVVPYGGADFGGGGGPLDAHYMFEADDGALIYINNRAYMKRVGETPNFAPPPPAPPAPGETFSQNFVAPPDSDVPLRMRTSPFFDAPRDGPHDWMNHTLFVGHGSRRVDPDRTIFTYYEVL